MKNNMLANTGLALLTVLGACASPNKVHDNPGLREDVLSAVWAQPQAQKEIDRVLYNATLNNQSIPRGTYEKARELYSSASAKNIQEFLEARKRWYKVAHRCYPAVIEGASSQSEQTEFSMATMHLMHEHSDLFSGIQRQTVQQSYAGIIDLVYRANKKD